MRILFEGVSKSFAKSGTVISGLSFVVEPGEFISLLGPSGSGKSTILRLISGLETPDAGRVIVGDLHQKTNQSSYVFQDASLMPWRTVEENVALPLELKRVFKKEHTGLVDEALALVGLRDAAGLFPHELSGGMKMRTSLARALVTRPKLLLLDEPLASLDENMRFALGTELRRIWEQTQLTVVFVTHSIAEATLLSDRALVISGKPAKIGADVTIALGRTRTPEMRTTTQFVDELRKVYQDYSAAHRSTVPEASL